MNPMLQSLLIIIIIGGIYFEMQTPGLGFPSAAAVTAAILYFAPLYIDGLAQNWEILVFIIGLLLIAAEIFIIPGFGIAGISGIIFLVAGLTLSLLNNTDFNFEEVSTKEIGEAVLTVLIGLGLGFILMIWLSNKIGTKGILRKVALHKDLEDAHSSPSLAPLIGKEGTAFTDLRPSGKVMIDNELYHVVSDSGFIECTGLCGNIHPIMPVYHYRAHAHRECVYRRPHIARHRSPAGRLKYSWPCNNLHGRYGKTVRH